MCSQFFSNIDVDELKQKFQITQSTEFRSQHNSLIAPRLDACVIMNNGKNYVLEKMKYGLIPSWSKGHQIQFSTHNARIENLLEKATWKKPFQKQRALVPITSFIEPIYVDSYAGNRVLFFEEGKSLIYAAAIYDKWINNKTGEIILSFAIVTQEAPSSVHSAGHHRCPVFLKEDRFEQWLDLKNQDVRGLLHLLKDSSNDFNFGVEVYRPMNPGWEKRVPRNNPSSHPSNSSIQYTLWR